MPSFRGVVSSMVMRGSSTSAPQAESESTHPAELKKRSLGTRFRVIRSHTTCQAPSNTSVVFPTDSDALSKSILQPPTSLSRINVAAGDQTLRPGRVKESKHSYRIQKNEESALGYLRMDYDCLDEAFVVARDMQRPILCIDSCLLGDIYFGREIFSHPLIVEAIETLFVTVNHKVEDPGASRCQIRFLDEFGSSVVPNVTSHNLSRAGVVQAMIEALRLCQQPVPKYLTLLREEETGYVEIGPGGPRPKDHCSVFGVDDAADGEVEFAGLDGVLTTRAGCIERQRVVEVTYDSRRLPYCCLVRFALKHNAGVIYYQTNDERVAAQVEVERIQDGTITAEFSGSIQPDYDPKRALRRTPLRFVPLTGLQATRANRLVQFGRFNEAMHLLSPRQGLILREAMHVAAQKCFHEVVDVPLLPAWLSVCEKQNPKYVLEVLRQRESMQTYQYVYQTA